MKPIERLRAASEALTKIAADIIEAADETRLRHDPLIQKISFELLRQRDELDSHINDLLWLARNL